MKRAVLILLAAACLGMSDDLDAVMGLLAMRGRAHVEFIEQQFIALRSRPVESSGDMRFEAPDRLEKRTLLPRTQTLLLAGGVLTVERAGQTQALDVRRYPQTQPFLDSLRATLAGDRRALEQAFHLAFAGGVPRWSLTLVPVDREVLRVVQQVRIDGARDQLLHVELRQANGDRSLMTLRPSTKP
jgi:hypothetical protein